MLNRKSLLSALAILALMFSTMGNKGCNSSDIANRAVKALSAVPSVVRVLFPTAEPTIFEDLDLAVTVFNEFISNKTASNFEKAKNIWNRAKGRLQRFGNENLNRVIAAVDILLTQIDTPASDSASAPVEIKFQESDVKALEASVKDLKKETK